MLQKDKYISFPLPFVISYDNADNTLINTLFDLWLIMRPKGFFLNCAWKIAQAVLNLFGNSIFVPKYVPWSQIEMSFISLVNIWDNVSGSTPLPPHKTYKCLRNFPAGLYTHARWHLFKNNFLQKFPQLVIFQNDMGPRCENIHPELHDLCHKFCDFPWVALCWVS